METYWITFEDGSDGSCDGTSELDARLTAERIKEKKVRSAEKLPYPAEPIIWQHAHLKYGPCPAFCYSPKTCAGNTSCPKTRACSE